MTAARRPPRLLMRTLAVTFGTVALLLGIVFVVVTLTVRNDVRQSVVSQLESSQRMFAALESRRQRELQAQAATIADSPTLIAALDTIQVEAARSMATNREAIETIDRELQKLAARVEADAIVLADPRGVVIDSAGRLGERWARGRKISMLNADAGRDAMTQSGDAIFRAIAVPLQLPDAIVGTLYLATAIDSAYAEDLGRLSGTHTAIVADTSSADGARPPRTESSGAVSRADGARGFSRADGARGFSRADGARLPRAESRAGVRRALIATTLSPTAGREFESSIGLERPSEGTVVLDGESFAFRRLIAIGDASFYALSSIDESSRPALRSTMRNLAVLAGAALALALLASFVLARLLAKPVGTLARSLSARAASRDVLTPLALTGSSREIDALTETFNALMSSVAEAEAQTEAAYTGAIRALATALDARDPYTAGHSERVSVLSVAIGRALALSDEELEVLRLGALLHDIGKIGVPDHVLMKPGALTAAEFASIRQHPVLGARILRPVPFLARHIPIVELHHERPDGQGYPLGLRGHDIPLPARIVHVADAYDAIISARAYRAARPPADALRELWRCAGTAFHAEVVGALANALPGLTSDVHDAVLETV
jgi:putative nucleotidyltransferase with HDIG domain